MIYAWAIGTPAADKADLNNRIDAARHMGEKAVCPLCDSEVVSVKNKHGIWEWVHSKRCFLKRRGKKRG